MMTFTDESIRTVIREQLDENADHIAFQAFGDLEQSVLDDIKSLRENVLVLDVPITGYVYDVFTGKVRKVARCGGGEERRVLRRSALVEVQGAVREGC